MPDSSRSRRARLAPIGPPSREAAAGLLARVARADERAFEQLYDEIAPTVWGLVRRVVRNHAQSEEVFQEAMVEVWRSASRFDPARGSVLAWVTTLAHRKAVDRVRSEEAAARREQRGVDRSALTPYDEVSEQAGRELDRQQVRRCLESLTAAQRESVLLAFYQGYSYPEVASLLELPLGTVKTRMRDGLIRLRDCLGVAR